MIWGGPEEIGKKIAALLRGGGGIFWTPLSEEKNFRQPHTEKKKFKELFAEEK